MDIDPVINIRNLKRYRMYENEIDEHLDVCQWLVDHGTAEDIKRYIRNTLYPRGAPLCIAIPMFLGWDLSRSMIMNGAVCIDGRAIWILNFCVGIELGSFSATVLKKGVSRWIG